MPVDNTKMLKGKIMFPFRMLENRNNGKIIYVTLPRNCIWNCSAKLTIVRLLMSL